MTDGTLTQSIGRRLRRIRHDGGRSLASVAQELGISSSALSQIETGAMQPSVNRLVELVGVLGVPISAIFDEPMVIDVDRTEATDLAEPIPGVVVGTASETTLAHLGQGVTYRRLTPFALPGIDLFESTYPAGTASSVDGAMLVHEGYETGCVTRGTLAFEFTEGEVRLSAGDSLAFEATRPHRVVNVGDDVAVSIWMTLPGGLAASGPRLS